MALGTVISRVTGMGRDIAITAALGSSLLADSYAVANSLPNIVYILVAGGALNAVFIPQLVRSLQAGAEQGNDFADRLITLTCLVLFVCTLMAMVVAPLTVGLYLHDGTSAQLDQAIVLARYCLPQIFYYGVYTMFSQVLNSRSSFAAPMFAPIINNIVMIITAVIFIYLTHGINVADGQVVCAFAVGAIPFAAFYILLRGAYARENTTTPLWLTVIYNLIAAPLMVVFFFLAPDPWRVFAIAAAYAISYWLLLPIAWFRLTHALSLSSRATIGFGVRVLAMSAVAGVFALGVSLIIIRLLSGQFSPALNQFTAIAALVTGSCIFGASCLMLARAMNISEIHTAWTRITTQLRRAAITTLKR